MSTQQDASIGAVKEVTFGTPVTVDTFPEFVSEDFAFNQTFSDPAASLRVGRRVAASDRRVLVKSDTSGSLTVEAFSKGLGFWLEAAFGTGTSTLASVTAYQQLFTPIADDYLPSYTIQKGLPTLAGSVTTQTYAGMVCSGFELNAQNGGIPTLQFDFMGKSVATDTAYATPSYVASNELFSFVDGAVTLGGTVTVPTTTALATGGTATTNIRDVSIRYDNGLDSEGFNFGASGQRSRKPALGVRAITGNLTVEFTDTDELAAFYAQTNLALVVTFDLPTAITGAYYPTLQFCAPRIRLDGELPKANGGDVIVQSIPFTVLDDRTSAHPFYAAIVTPETAI